MKKHLFNKFRFELYILVARSSLNVFRDFLWSFSWSKTLSKPALLRPRFYFRLRSNVGGADVTSLKGPRERQANGEC